MDIAAKCVLLFYTSGFMLAFGALSPPWIEYRGCRGVQITNGLTPVTVANNSPTSCFSRCTGGADYVAIQEDTCFCIAHEPDKTKHLKAVTQCDQSCKGDKSFYCGGKAKANATAVSLYAKVPTVAFNTSVWGCLAFDTGRALYTVHPCDKGLGAPTVCYKKGTALHPSDCSIERSAASWTEAVQICFSAFSILPPDSHDFTACTYLPAQFWMGIVRRNSTDSIVTTTPAVLRASGSTSGTSSTTTSLTTLPTSSSVSVARTTSDVPGDTIHENLGVIVGPIAGLLGGAVVVAAVLYTRYRFKRKIHPPDDIFGGKGRRLPRQVAPVMHFARFSRAKRR